ncbi:hypothetical protein V2G26_001524 [Clonostachys chloroleuca]
MSTTSRVQSSKATAGIEPLADLFSHLFGTIEHTCTRDCWIVLVSYWLDRGALFDHLPFEVSLLCPRNAWAQTQLDGWKSSGSKGTRGRNVELESSRLSCSCLVFVLFKFFRIEDGSWTCCLAITPLRRPG